MDYQYFKSRSLNSMELNRLHLSNEIDSQLRSLRQSGNAVHSIKTSTADGKSDRLIQEIVAYLSLSSTKISAPAIDWMLCYASHESLQRLLQILERNRPTQPKLKFFSLAAPAQILVNEKITPDYQRCQITPDPKTALVCFTGNAQRLNMPLQLFHGVLGREFDIVIYLRDDSRQKFINGVPGMGNNLQELGEAIREVIPEDCHTAILSTSSGGVAATRVAEVMGVDRLALFSPEFSFRDELAVEDPSRISAESALLYFAAKLPFDNKLAAQWKNTHLGPSIKFIEAESHGTLSHILFSCEFQPLVNWLNGRNDSLV